MTTRLHSVTLETRVSRFLNLQLSNVLCWWVVDGAHEMVAKPSFHSQLASASIMRHCLLWTPQRVLFACQAVSVEHLFEETFGLHSKKGTSVTVKISEAIERLDRVYRFDKECVDAVMDLTDTTAVTQGPQGTVSSVVMEDERRILKSLRDINNDILDRFDPGLADKFNMKSVLTLVVENTFSEMRSGATDMPMKLEFDYRFSRAIKERLMRQCYTPFAYFTAPKSLYPHTFTSTDYKDLPKLRPPKSRKLSARQVNEMRNWRAMHGQSVPQKTVRNMTTKDNPGTLPINLYAADSPPVEPLDFSALSQAPAVPTPQRDRPVTLYEQGQIVCVRGHSCALFVIASLQEDTLVGAKRVRAKVYNQDPFNAIIFTEDTEKYVEVNNIMCVISNYKSSNDILELVELEEGDLILLLDQLQNMNELVTVTEAAELSAETETTNELQSEQARTRRTRGRKRRFEEDFFYYE